MAKMAKMKDIVTEMDDDGPPLLVDGVPPVEEPAPEPDDPVPADEDEELQHEPVTPPDVAAIDGEDARRIAFDVAFCAFQGEVQNPPKRRTANVRHRAEKGGGEHSYKYADLADVLVTAKPVLTKHGLSYEQDLVRDGRDWLIETVLIHVGGHRRSRGLFPVGTAGGDPKTFGAALTYARRYALSLALGIASETDTDAGNGGTHTAYDRNPNAWRDELAQSPPRRRELPPPADDGPPLGDYRGNPRQRLETRTTGQVGQNAGGRSPERYAPRDEMPGEPTYEFLAEHMPVVNDFRRWLQVTETERDVYVGWTENWSGDFKALGLSEPLYQKLLAEANQRRAFHRTQEQMRQRQ